MLWQPLYLNISHLEYTLTKSSLFRIRCSFNLPISCFKIEGNYLPCKISIVMFRDIFMQMSYNKNIIFILGIICIIWCSCTKRNNCITQSNQLVLCWCCKVTMLVNERLLSYLNGKESSLNSGTMIFQVQNLRCMIKINIMSFFHGCVWKNETVLR